MKSSHRIAVAFCGIALLLAVAFGLAWHVRDRSAPNDKLQIVAAENVWGSIADQIGGDHVQVTSIISNPNTDPHLYESDAANARAVARAVLVIKNGLGYDDFMDKLLAASGSSQRTVIAVNQVEGVSGSDPNPHLWYDLPSVPRVAEAIEQALILRDPTHQENYAANLKHFDDSMLPLTQRVNQIKAQYAGTPVAYTERVPGYLLDEAGLASKTPLGFASAIEDGNDPSPSDTTAMDDLVTGHQVKVLLYNPQTTSPVTQHVRELAAAAGVPVMETRETMPTGMTYQAWQLSQIVALQQALGASR